MSNNKRLERDLSNKVLGGVCSGLGNYFDIDPTFWRILFFVLFFAGCSGLLIYVILWIVMPEAKCPGAANSSDPQSVVLDANGKPVQENGRWLAGLILIGIGGIWLLARYVPQISWQTVWPVILICVGVYFLLPSNNKQS